MAKYKNSPLLEAICEFQFDPVDAWDIVSIGLIYEQLRTRFPVRRSVPELDIQKGISAVVQTSNRAQFLNERETQVIQVGEHSLAINQLQNYSKWAEFADTIAFALDAYRNVVSPKCLKKVSCTFINVVHLPVEKLMLGDYFNLVPAVQNDLQSEFKSFRSFLVGVETACEKNSDTLRLELTSAGSQKSGLNAIRLDIEYASIDPTKIGLDSIKDWLHVAHLHIDNAFEGCITEKLREKMGKIL